MFKQYTGFDHEDVLKPGTPIRITICATNVSFYGLISMSNIQTLKYADSKGNIQLLHVDDVLNDKYKIEPLVFEEVK